MGFPPRGGLACFLISHFAGACFFHSDGNPKYSTMRLTSDGLARSPKSTRLSHCRLPQVNRSAPRSTVTNGSTKACVHSPNRVANSSTRCLWTRRHSTSWACFKGYHHGGRSIRLSCNGSIAKMRQVIPQSVSFVAVRHLLMTGEVSGSVPILQYHLRLLSPLSRVPAAATGTAPAQL